MSAIHYASPTVHHAAEANSVRRTTDHYVHQSRLLYLLVIAIVSTCMLVLLDGGTVSAPWLITLFAVGILTILLMPTMVAGLTTLGLTALWAVVRHTVDRWGVEDLPMLALEVGAIALTFLVGLAFQRQWIALRKHTLTTLTTNYRLGIAQVETEVLPYVVGELRLMEEMERASHFGRSLALLVVETEFLRTLPIDEQSRLERAIKRQLAIHTQLHDITFQIDSKRIGIVLPERDYVGAMQELYRLEEVLLRTDETHGVSRDISEVIRISIAIKSYAGMERNARDLIAAANVPNEATLLAMTGDEVTRRVQPWLPS